MKNSPEEQAKRRLKELESLCDGNETNELYTWNIAKITETNEHYNIVKETKSNKPF